MNVIASRSWQEATFYLPSLVGSASCPVSPTVNPSATLRTVKEPSDMGGVYLRVSPAVKRTMTTATLTKENI